MMRRPVLRVGKIPYANLYPLFRALERRLSPGEVRYVTGTPRELNRKLRAGRVDISPSSSVEYGRYPDRYLLCPDISISSRTRVMSVYLFSRLPVEKLPDDPIAVSGDSDTSVVLLEVLLREFLGKKARLVRADGPPAESLRRHPACLAIGDAAIRARLRGVGPHATDLGEWWHRETGTPFVFALWIVSREALRSREEAVRRFARELLAAKREARDEIDGPRGGFATPDLPGMPARFLREYWRNLSYELSAEIEGLALFFRLAEKIGRLPAAPPLRFLDVEALAPC